MTQSDRVTQKQILDIAPAFTLQSMSMVAIGYMEYEYETLNGIRSDEKRVSEYVTEVLRFWAQKKNNTTKKLAAILYDAGDSGLVNSEKVKTALGFDRNEVKLESNDNPKKTKGLSTKQLGLLAEKISAKQMKTIAERDMHMEFAAMDNKKMDNDGAWWFTLGILWEYLNKADNNSESLKKILVNSGEVAPGVIDIFNEDNEANSALQSEGGSEGHQSGQKRRRTSGGTSEASMDKPEDVYDMTSELPGYVLIFNNKEFVTREGDRNGTDEDLRRNGTDEDARRLTEVFSQRGFKVVEEKDLSAKDMTIKVKAFARKDELKSKELIENFLKDIKLNEEKIKKREEMLTQLENVVFEKGKAEEASSRRIKLSLIEEKREEINESMTTEQKDNFKAIFKLCKEKIEKLDEPMTKAEIDVFLQEVKIDSDEIENVETFLTKMKDEDLKKADCCVVVLMSHGGKGFIRGKRWEKIDTNRIIDEFTSDNCKALAGKPKAFLVQACRGERRDVKTDSKTAKHEMVPKVDFIGKGDQATPRSADMLVGYATTVGLVSYRYDPEGTVFIEEFCNVLDESEDEVDVLAMTLKVNKQVAAQDHLVDGRQVKQMSEFRHSLRKTWKLPKKVTKE